MKSLKLSIFITRLINGTYNYIRAKFIAKGLN